MKSEKIIICSGPSGSGKSSLVDFVLKKKKKKLDLQYLPHQDYLEKTKEMVLIIIFYP